MRIILSIHFFYFQPPREITTPLPVMVFVHGGGFIFGSGSRKLYSADLFMKHDIILVTFNYRLHALGILIEKKKTKKKN